MAQFIIHHFAKQGYKVGAIKHIHHSFTMDTRGKDTWRFSSAGAKMVISVAPGEVAVIKKTASNEVDLDDLLAGAESEKMDILILEGFRDQLGRRKDIPKVVTAKDTDELKSLMKNMSQPIVAVSGVVAEDASDRLEFKLPVVNVVREGDRLIKLVKHHLGMARPRSVAAS